MGWWFGKRRGTGKKRKKIEGMCSSHENVLVHLIYVGLELGIACSGTAQSLQVSVSLWKLKMCNKDAFPWLFREAGLSSVGSIFFMVTEPKNHTNSQVSASHFCSQIIGF